MSDRLTTCRTPAHHLLNRDTDASLPLAPPCLGVSALQIFLETPNSYSHRVRSGGHSLPALGHLAGLVPHIRRQPGGHST